jgi:cellulose synthase (UDP-forming)
MATLTIYCATLPLIIAETALKLHGLGLKSAYLGIPMISGLQPETFSGFILQRVRWAQGMMQIFLLSNPWRSKTLSLWQKLSYTNSSFFWFFPFARTVFLVAPTAFLVFGLKIYDANLTQFVAYALPHLFGAILVADFLYGKVRWTLISELYETMQSLFSLVAIFKVFINPRLSREQTVQETQKEMLDALDATDESRVSVSESESSERRVQE